MALEVSANGFRRVQFSFCRARLLFSQTSNLEDQVFALCRFMNLSRAQNSRRHSSVGRMGNHSSPPCRLGKLPGEERVFSLLMNEIDLRVVRAASG